LKARDPRSNRFAQSPFHRQAGRSQSHSLLACSELTISQQMTTATVLSE
jgi:hypothetical protein